MQGKTYLTKGMAFLYLLCEWCLFVHTSGWLRKKKKKSRFRPKIELVATAVVVVVVLNRKKWCCCLIFIASNRFSNAFLSHSQTFRLGSPLIFVSSNQSGIISFYFSFECGMCRCLLTFNRYRYRIMIIAG